MMKQKKLKCTVSHGERIPASTDSQWSETQPDSLPLVALFKAYANYNMFRLV